MQAIKKEPSYSEGEDLVLAMALQGTDRDMINQNLPFKAKSNTCRRKREFIPEEKKDTLYWERRRKNNEAAKRSREKRRLNDMVLENKLMVLGEENASLKAELLSLKLKFGLLSAAAYAQEVQKITSSTNALYQEFVPSKCVTGSYPKEAEPSCLSSSCISVIKHSPHSTSSDGSDSSTINTCRTPEIIKREPLENSNYSRDRASPYELYRNYLNSPYPGSYPQPNPFLQLTRSSSNSPRTSDGDDGTVSKSSDGEDEQQVPKGLAPSAADQKSVIVSAVKVPDANASALPHKLRIKARAIQIKVENIDPDYDSSGKLSSPIDMSARTCYQMGQGSPAEYTQSSISPLSLQVNNVQDWIQQPEYWHKDQTEASPNGYKNRLCPVSPEPMTNKLVVNLKDGCYAISESENLYLKRGIADLSAEVTSLKKVIATRQGSVIESTKSTTEPDLVSKGCYSN
ncbi:Nuclear factor interleukin-3-regulated protein [Bagarius yarrelli]|uniref:Nuclear factor interleukin-3-regulated protein n=1 Tax=Bagarius yarrelli TaxID=175774 RepID=A0A556V2P3_BAGYA|nr:Nuclear factor interleukin-3-regulated protein [Bagarius yarrelli]